MGLSGSALCWLFSAWLSGQTWSVGDAYPVWMRMAGGVMVLAVLWSASWIWIAFQGAERRVREGLGLPQGIAGLVANTLAALAMPMGVGHLMHGLLFAWYAHTFTSLPVADMGLLQEQGIGSELALACHRQPFWSPLQPDPQMLTSSWLVTGWQEVSE
jgi:hypothetical protein